MAYKVIYNGKKRDYHGLWDSGLVGAVNPGSYTDLAEVLDRSSDAQIAEIVKGDVYDWGEDVANTALRLRKYKANDVISPSQFKHDYLDEGELLIRKAGYRLAKVLNDIFE